MDGAGQTIFYYEYPTVGCNTAYNSIPIHLENTKFPIVGPQALNLSARGTVAGGERALIGGFIVTGTEDKKVLLRALGPSLSASGISGALADPVLTVIDSSGSIVATNDGWESDASAAEITAAGLAPTDPLEAATIQTFAPGAYTVVATGKDDTSGISLLEAYDLSAELDSQLANISARGFVGTDPNVLIAGLIVGDVANATVVIRALGPSLGSRVSEPLHDPTISIFDSNGDALATNDNWQDDPNSLDDYRKHRARTNSRKPIGISFFTIAGAYLRSHEGC